MASARIETLSDSPTVLKGRKLSMLPSPKIELTPEVRRELQVYTHQNSTFIASALNRGEEYLPMVRQIFADEGVPPQLLNLAIIESGFRPDAKSPAGAAGIWQFMKSTARLYGLKVTPYEDQRHDPILSSIAAARHLRDLYLSYNDWLLALAAYNAGSGSIDRALMRTGAEDFWTLSRKAKNTKLRRETLRYVPRFVAITWAIENDERFSTKAVG